MGQMVAQVEATEDPCPYLVFKSVLNHAKAGVVRLQQGLCKVGWGFLFVEGKEAI